MMISHGTPAKVGIVSYTSKEDIDALGIQQFGFKGWQHAGVGTPTGNDFGWRVALFVTVVTRASVRHKTRGPGPGPRSDRLYLGLPSGPCLPLSTLPYLST